jgi:uncharacterized repeat protein (TIGR02543 family)
MSFVVKRMSVRIVTAFVISAMVFIGAGLAQPAFAEPEATQEDTPEDTQEATYVVTLNLADGKGTKTGGNSYSSGEKLGKLPTAKRVGYKFQGWYAGDTKVTKNTIVTEKLTLKAKWKKVKVKTYTPPLDRRSANLTKKQKQQAQKIAKKIAKSIPAGFSDMELVGAAAQKVSAYYYQGSYLDQGPYYSTAYGVFIKKQASCAGCTRALRMVLGYMGYQSTHVNENQWTHQWLKLKMDGKNGYADGQVGWAGYGRHPADG